MIAGILILFLGSLNSFAGCPVQELENTLIQINQPLIAGEANKSNGVNLYIDGINQTPRTDLNTYCEVTQEKIKNGGIIKITNIEKRFPIQNVSCNEEGSLINFDVANFPNSFHVRCKAGFGYWLTSKAAPLAIENIQYQFGNALKFTKILEGTSKKSPITKTLIVGGEDSFYKRTKEDNIFLKSFKKYYVGMTKNNISVDVLYDGSDKDYLSSSLKIPQNKVISASKTNLLKILDSYLDPVKGMKKGEELLINIDTHSGEDGDIALNDSDLSYSDPEFISRLEKIKARGVKIAFITSACFGGKAIEPLKKIGCVLSDQVSNASNEGSDIANELVNLDILNALDSSFLNNLEQKDITTNKYDRKISMDDFYIYLLMNERPRYFERIQYSSMPETQRFDESIVHQISLLTEGKGDDSDYISGNCADCNQETAQNILKSDSIETFEKLIEKLNFELSESETQSLLDTSDEMKTDLKYMKDEYLNLSVSLNELRVERLRLSSERQKLLSGKSSDRYVRAKALAKKIDELKRQSQELENRKIDEFNIFTTSAIARNSSKLALGRFLNKRKLAEKNSKIASELKLCSEFILKEL